METTLPEIAMPDADLRYRVASIPQSEDDYRRVGGWNADIIAAEFLRHGTPISQVGALLDFGCGCGRALQYLHNLAPGVALHGSDIDEPAIAWCQQHLPYARCQVNAPEPPLDYPDQSFDGIVALSVFSHLDAPMQRRWLAELARVLRPGGCLLLSFSGPFVLERCREQYSPESVQEYEQSGFAFVRNITDGAFPSWYQTSLQNIDFIAACLPQGLRVTGYLEQGLSGWQDLAMVKRHPDAAKFSPSAVGRETARTTAEPVPTRQVVSGSAQDVPILEQSVLEQAILAVLESPKGQTALCGAVHEAWRTIREDTGAMIGLRSTLRSARFVERHIPLHLARDHGQLRHRALKAASPSGLFLEFGVLRAHWLNQFATWLPDIVFHGFDSFEGLPEDWSIFPVGYLSVDGVLPPVEPNVRLVKGWFSDTLPRFLEEHSGTVAFVHVDCDVYSSTKTVFDLLKDRFRVGTQIVLDDFMQAPGWENEEFKAFFEFVEASGFGFEYTGWSAGSPGCSVSIAITSIAQQGRSLPAPVGVQANRWLQGGGKQLARGFRLSHRLLRRLTAS